MEYTKGLFESLKQHHKLAIRISSHDSTHTNIPKGIYRILLKPHRNFHYFFFFLTKGQASHSVDLQDVAVKGGQLLFVLPHQIHLLPKKREKLEFFKLNLDEDCLTHLPKPFPFLVNPNNNQVITFDAKALQRVKAVFEILSQLLQTRDSDTELILANLNTLFTEFNQAYFKNNKTEIATNGLSTFIQFKLIIEKELTEQPSIASIAKKLAVTDNSLYYIVKNHSGLSPKEFITNRLILEAQRKLYYSETTVKELAFDLGFSDPDYFSKLFKKNTGKSITQFVEDVKDLSGN